MSKLYLIISRHTVKKWNKHLFFLILFLIAVFPCFSGGPYELENGFYYMWMDADVYDKPDFSSNIIKNVKFNTKVEVLDCISKFDHNIDNIGDYWYIVNIDSSEGYIFGSNFTHKIIEHFDKYGNEYIIYIHFWGQNSEGIFFNTNTIKIFLNNKEIPVVFPDFRLRENIEIEDYSKNSDYSFSFSDFDFYNNIFMFSFDYLWGNSIYRFTFRFNNTGVNFLRINHNWGYNNDVQYSDSVLLKWDNENNIYYEVEDGLEIEEDLNEQYYNGRSDTDNGSNEIITWEDFNFDEWSNDSAGNKKKFIIIGIISLIILTGIVVLTIYFIKKKK